MSVSKRIGEYMRSKGYNLSVVAKLTGLNYQSLYRSLYSEDFERDLRAEELIPLCVLLNVDPRMFAPDSEPLAKDDS